MLVELKSNESIQDHLEEGKIAIVKFATTTCPPCKMLKPVFEKLSGVEDLENVVFIAADANSHPQAGEYGVSSVPTLLFFKGSDVLGQNVGFVPEQPLHDFLKKLETEELAN
ncbi:Thioredoxin [Candidatus Izimaplasma bacterium HR1]|jgi:thioredoxin 1|uniref:thioredoxin family protein n=1 Tax=Candidatus Izimoplasma sp. HR1 TaxID=1541959 RepID=UPI0004F5DE4D|nr:Thioredoxin [Candidatus Izimaplasma bacterium HR1]